MNPRAALRNRLYLAGLLPALLCLLVCVKLALMLAHAGDGRSAYAAGEYAGARDAYAANRTLNLVQRWIAPFNEGDARFGLGDYPGAVEAFTAALPTVPDDRACLVRVNLALSHEAIGDAAAAGDDASAARDAWEAGRTALADCPAADPAAGEVDARLAAKLGEPAPSAQPSEQPEQAPDESGDDSAESKVERLEEANEKALTERQDNRDLGDYGTGSWSDDYQW